MATTTCNRAGCDEEVDRAEGVWPYCSKFCKAIDTRTDTLLDALVPPPHHPSYPPPPPSDDPAPPFSYPQVNAAEILANEPVLPTDSAERKEMPIFSGLLNYFPLACAAISRHSKRGNDKHNPGEPLHWARGKSGDHADCIARHLIDHLTIHAETGEYEEACAMAWRAMALLQELEEKRLGKAMSRGSR